MKESLHVERHPASRRSGILADEGASVWLYLTEPDGQQIAADCWIFNTISAPDNLEAFGESNGPPPATSRFVIAGGQAPFPAPDEVRFKWAEDGESVAVHVRGMLAGFIARGDRRGYSRYLALPGPFGNPIDESLHAALFAGA